MWVVGAVVVARLGLVFAVVAFLSFTVTTYLRFRSLETSYTRLARRIALESVHRERQSAGADERADDDPAPGTPLT